MTSRILASTLLTLAAASLSVSALAETPRAEGAEISKNTDHRMLQRYDTDRDGTISLQEFQAAGDALFDKLDADGDGRISAEEFASARRWGGREHHGHRMERRAEGSEARGGASRSETRQRGSHHGRHQYWFARMDADGDGYVTRAEFDDARMALFHALDVDGNGVIDASELPARKGGRKGHGWRDRSGASATE
jgi:Ca2+-binding EF-hand superfamily protein